MDCVGWECDGASGVGVRTSGSRAAEDSVVKCWGLIAIATHCHTGIQAGEKSCWKVPNGCLQTSRVASRAMRKGHVGSAPHFCQHARAHTSGPHSP
eukprot:364494-Chlamydomonas_euryale.AAC.2